MRRAPAAVLVALLALGCAREPVPADDLALRIESDAYEVHVAEGFPLTVTRSWSKEIVPEEWSDETLSPLVVRLVDVERSESATHVRERRRYRAYAPELGDVRVLPPLFVGERANGGGEVVFTGDALDLRVLPVLPRDDASAVELPGGMLRPRTPWGAWLAGAGALVVIALLAARGGRPRAEPEDVAAEPVPPPEPPHIVALRALDAAEPRCADPDPRPLHDAVSEALRTYLRARFGVGAPESTTQELLRAASRADVPRSRALHDLLTRADLVRFADVHPDVEQRADVLRDARAFVEATAGDTA